MMSRKQEALWSEGQRAGAAGKWSQAAAAYESIVQHDPAFVPGWLELCSAYEQLDRYRAAHGAILAAARVGGVPPMVSLAVARRLRQFEEIGLAERYIHATSLAQRVPPERLVDLISFLASAGRHDMSVPWVEALLRHRPTAAESHHMHGVVLMFAGALDGAADAFRRALRIDPGHGNSYAMLSRVRKATGSNNRVDALTRLLSKPSLARKDETNFSLALHNELHDLGDVDGAWLALERMCRLRAADQPYSHTRTLAIVDTLRTTFDEIISSDPLAPKQSPTPIFIVGMHRSGTTLLERMLAGNPAVADAGETYTFTAALRHATDHFCRQSIDPVMASRLAGVDYREVGARFMRGMQLRSLGRPFVTEKLNPNFLLLGPIAKALPGARVLHMQRDPMDTCFSNLRTLFTHEAAYSYRQDDLADFYSAYRALMDHWAQVLPHRILQVEYERMVGQPEAEARRISEYCGFAFVPDMLDLGREGGHVSTASSSQVRGGIVRNRGGVWRAYAKHLQPLQERLTTLGFC